MANIKYRKSDGTYETITNYNVQPLVPVQETGDSVIDVMSQKAVTDALNNLSAKGYEYNEDNVSFYIGDKEDAKLKIRGNTYIYNPTNLAIFKPVYLFLFCLNSIIELQATLKYCQGVF